MARASVTLTSYNMGSDATEADYDRWIAIVASRIQDKCGFNVDVDSLRFGEAGDDRIEAASDEDETTVREAIAALWEGVYCAEDEPVKAAGR